MTCQEVRRYLSAFLDSELDPRTSLDVSAHCDACPPCRERVDAESRLERALRDKLDQTPVCPKFWARVEGGLCAERGWLCRARVVAAAAAVLLAVGGAGYVLWPRGGVGGPMGADLTAAAREVLAPIATARAAGVGTVLPIASWQAFSAPAEANRWLEASVHVPVVTPGAESRGGHKLELVGGGFVRLGGVETPVLIYTCCGADIALLALTPTVVAAFPEAKCRLTRDGKYVCHVEGRSDVVVRQFGPLVLCASATHCADTLVEAFRDTAR